MERSILTLSFMIIALLGVGQKLKVVDVPSAVKSAFMKKYANARSVKWNKENGNFEASFDLEKIDNSVLFDPFGKILETEVQVPINQLPEGIAEFVKLNYKGSSIKEAAKITNTEGAITYEAAVKGKDLIFDSAGKFIKETKN